MSLANLDQAMEPASRRPKSLFQALAVGLCILLALAMIVNTQLGGEAMWFWYATLFHRGAKLYSELHTPLQPFFVLETDLWMRLFGVKCLVTQVPSLVHATVLAVGMFLVLRESSWPDWQKGLLLAGAFVVTVVGTSYRFDDYHVLAENFILYSLLLLLWLARAERKQQQLWLALGLGVLTGLTLTTRLTDGAALLLSVGLSLVVLARGRKLLPLCVYLVAAACIVLLLVRLTGDSFATYLSSTLIKAAGSKGGTGSIFAAPFLFLRNALLLLRQAGKWILVWVLAIAAAGALLRRYRQTRPSHLFALQVALAAATFLLVPHASRHQLLTGSFVAEITLVLTILTYVLGPVVAARYLLAKAGKGTTPWDAREILVALPLAEWASYSAGAGAEPHTGYYAPVAMLLLLVAVLGPFRRAAPWANLTFLTVITVLLVTGISTKILIPYSWQNYDTAPMFRNRVWVHHPVYGPLYIDRDLLAFSSSVCDEMGGEAAHPELLSLPYPYPNYFCATPPWHGYVQTFFDTSTRATIDHLIGELKTAPPQWIVYQRQLHILTGAERLYNHGQPLAQRDLDHLIMDRIGSGKWQLVDRKDYLVGDGWYIIRTTPANGPGTLTPMKESQQ